MAAAAAADQQRHAIAWTDRRHLPDAKLVSRLELEIELCEKRGGDRLDLELTEAHPDADPRAAAERHVGTLRQCRLRFRGEALRAELLGLGEHMRKVVRDPRAVVDIRPARNRVTRELVR